MDLPTFQRDSYSVRDKRRKIHSFIKRAGIYFHFISVISFALVSAITFPLAHR